MTNHSASNAAQAGARQAIELEQFEAELRPKRPIDLSHAHLRLGIDVGSTTVKLAVIDDNDNLIYANYERHHTDVKATARQVFEKAQAVLGDAPMRVSITGSGGMLLAQWLGVEFVQEVIASKNAVEALIPQTDCAIELGGEDAKIIYFDNGIEQRMNGTCAGGTGAFIDQMAQGRRAHLPDRLALRRLRQVRRPAAPQRGRGPRRRRRLDLPGGRQPDHLRPRLRPPHPRLRRLPRRSPPVPLRAARPLLQDAQARRGPPPHSRERPPLRRHGRGPCRRVRQVRHLRRGHPRPRQPR